MVKRQQLGSEHLVSILVRNVMGLPGLAYASAKCSCADWRAANGKVATDDVPAKVKVSSIDVHDVEDLSLLLKRI